MNSLNLKIDFPQFLKLFVSTFTLLLLAACGGNTVSAPEPTQPPSPQEIVYYDWDGDMPQFILDAFTEQHGIAVTYVTYEEQEEAVENIRAGETYDVVVMNNEFIPSLKSEGLLSELNHENIPNIKNISANFRDLAYDPGNKYSIPYNWGTTGLIVRNDLVDEPVTQWADLWNPQYAGHIGLYATESRTVLALALKSLGYSVNSDNKTELEQALDHLLSLDSVILTEDASTAPLLVNEQAIIALGFADDASEGQAQLEDITYVLPEEGPILWGDNFIIPANTSNQTAAELFINFLMDPEINAQLTNETEYATPNEAAYPFIDEELINNPYIFPPNELLANAEILLPLSQEGEALHAEIWAKFLSANK